MTHDVFVSYSSKDKAAADAIVNALESSGLRCWVAPRDILPGRTFGGAIIEGINAARVMLLIYSAHSNASQQVMREVERAVNRAMPIVPIRLQDVPMSGDMEYFISSPHWLDALTPPIQDHLARIRTAVVSLVDASPGAAVRAPARELAPATKPSGKRKIVIAATLAAATLVLALIRWPQRTATHWQAPDPALTPPATAPTDRYAVTDVSATAGEPSKEDVAPSTVEAARDPTSHADVSGTQPSHGHESSPITVADAQTSPLQTAASSERAAAVELMERAKRASAQRWAGAEMDRADEIAQQARSASDGERYPEAARLWRAAAASYAKAEQTSQSIRLSDAGDKLQITVDIAAPNVRQAKALALANARDTARDVLNHHSVNTREIETVLAQFEVLDAKVLEPGRWRMTFESPLTMLVAQELAKAPPSGEPG